MADDLPDHDICSKAWESEGRAWHITMTDDLPSDDAVHESTLTISDSESEGIADLVDDTDTNIDGMLASTQTPSYPPYRTFYSDPDVECLSVDDYAEFFSVRIVPYVRQMKGCASVSLDVNSRGAQSRDFLDA